MKPKLQSNEKAPAGSNRQRLLGNQNFINAGGISKGFDVLDFSATEEKIQLSVLSLINKKPRKVIKLVSCDTCKKPYRAEMMSEYRKLCQNCLESARTKTPREKRRFVDSALNNFHKFLRGAVAL